MEPAEDQVNRLVWTDELMERFWDGVRRTSLDELSFGKLAGPQLVELLCQYLPVGATVCDYGAGGGHLARLLIDRGFPTAIYEPSRYRAANLGRDFDGVEGFLGVIAADDRSRFDALIMSEVLEHLPDEVLHHTLQRARVLLADGGRLVVTAPNNENLAFGEAYCPQCNSVFHRWQHLRSFTARSLAELLERHGFSSEAIGLVDFSADADAVDHARLTSEMLRLGALFETEAGRFAEALRAEYAHGPLSVREQHALQASIASRQAAMAERIRHSAAAKPPTAALSALLLQLACGFYARLAADVTACGETAGPAPPLRTAVLRAVSGLRAAARRGLVLAKMREPIRRLQFIEEQLGSIGQRIALALDELADPPPHEQRAALGYDFYRGRGSTIFYVGEKR